MNNELNKLRSLLFADELEQLVSIQDQLKQLSGEVRTPELVIEHLSPLFTAIVNKAQTRDKQQLLDTFSPIVNTLIDESYETSKEKITSQLAPLIGSAIREQVKSQKDDVVDALYPVIGNMISRYVSKSFEDMINNINKQIQKGLSFKNISRKIKARLQGVSESELLLQEHATTNIRALFLIHKESGTILCEAQNPQNPITEPQMVASMLSAIKSFIDDWIKRNEDNSEVGEIEYGANKIIIEASGYSYLAVIVNGVTDTRTYDQIRQTLEEITYNNGEDIRNFNGDLSTFANIEVYKRIATLLSHSSNEQKDSTTVHPIMYVLPLIILSWFGWVFYKDFRDNSLNMSVLKKLHATPQLTLYHITTNVHDATVTLNGEVPFAYHKQLASRVIAGLENVQKVNNRLVIVPTLHDPMQISSNISYLLEGFNTQEGINLTYKYNYPEVSITGSVYNAKQKQKILSKIKNIEGIEKINDHITITPPHIKKYIFFDTGSATISPQYEIKLIELISELKKLDKNTVIRIDGYSDDHGSQKIKERIAALRAQRVAQYLTQKGALTLKTDIYSHTDLPNELDLINHPGKARCVIISVEKGR